jgi:hypothetical protein
MTTRGFGIVPETRSGGTHTSRTIMLRELSDLLAECPVEGVLDAYEEAAIVRNVLGKRTDSTRRRTLRYLRELYVLDRRSWLFRALRDLWDADELGRPLLALLCALGRDPLLRATGSEVLDTPLGGTIDSVALARAIETRYGAAYSDAVRDKIGRNTASSWTQSGHLQGRSTKVRVQAVSTPATVAYAFMIGHLTGARGQGLLETVWGRCLDAPQHQVIDQAFAASQRGWIEFRHSGGVMEVGFRWLLRPTDESSTT